MTPTGHLDTEACYRAVQSRDRRFDGVFYTAVAWKVTLPAEGVRAGHEGRQ